MICLVFAKHAYDLRATHHTSCLLQEGSTIVRKELKYVNRQSRRAVTDNEKGGFTHGFVVEFKSTEDRDYYVTEDPSHQAFVKKNGAQFDDVRVIDYEKGVY